MISPGVPNLLITNDLLEQLSASISYLQARSCNKGRIYGGGRMGPNPP